MAAGRTDTAPGRDAGPHPAASVVGRIAEAWARQDADAFARVFTPDATMVLPGSHTRGRVAIADHMRRGFGGPYAGSTVTGSPVDVVPLGEDVVLVITEGGVIPAGAPGIPEKAAVRATWVVVRQDGGWGIAHYQNSPREAL